MVDLSIVLVNYHTTQHTLHCIQSLVDSIKSISYEIIVIDNSSIDYRKDFTFKQTNIQYFPMGYNSGFARANNFGYQKAKGKYILILNNDTRISDNAIELALQKYKALSLNGILTIKLIDSEGILNFSASNSINGLRHYINGNPLFIYLIRGKYKYGESKKAKATLLHEKSGYVSWVTGAFMLFSRDIIKTPILFDVDYFMYSEDVDLCYRLSKQGKRHYYFAEVQIEHVNGGSFHEEISAFRESQIIMSELLFHRKNRGVFYFILSVWLFRINLFIEHLLLKRKGEMLSESKKVLNKSLKKYWISILFLTFPKSKNTYLKVY